jgi:hypothetical protein
VARHPSIVALSLSIWVVERDHPTIQWHLVSDPLAVPSERGKDIRESIGGHRPRTISHLKVQMGRGRARVANQPEQVARADSIAPGILGFPQILASPQNPTQSRTLCACSHIKLVLR